MSGLAIDAAHGYVHQKLEPSRKEMQKMISRLTFAMSVRGGDHKG